MSQDPRNPVPLPAPPPSMEELMAFADGRLAEPRRAAVALHLTTDPNAGAIVAALRRQTAALRAELDGVLDEPVPPRLLRRRRRAAGGGSRRLAFAAVIAALVIGSAAGWSGRGILGQNPSLQETLALRASLAYTVFAGDTGVTLDIRETGAGEVADWLRSRFEISAPPPVLTDLGFRLAGGRLMMGETAPAALLVYDGSGDRRLVVFLRTDLRPTSPQPPRLVDAPAATTVYWTTGAIGVAVAGRLPDQELMRTARFIGAGLGG